MKSLEFDHHYYLQAFMKTAQYLAGLTTYEDVWSHIGNVMLKLYGADLAGFAKRLPEGTIEFHHMACADGVPMTDCASCGHIRQWVVDVLESGFLATHTPTCGRVRTVVLLPVNLGNDPAGVMLVGHADFDRVPNEVLNVYLAIAGLAGSTITKLNSEVELKRHRTQLETLVSERTMELTRTLDRLELEIKEHMQAEDELRRYRDHLQELVMDRTEELSVANEELRNYSAKLERINEQLEEFAFVASHDLQEPLRKIQIFGSRLRADYGGSLGPEGEDFLDRMTNSANRMSALLKSLRAYSRVASATFPFEPTDLSQAAREAVSDLEIAIDRVEARVEIAPLFVIEADSAQMRELFQNLIANSLKYCREYAKPLIRIESLVEDGKCRIYVKDNGIGFDTIHLDRIFKPFQRLHGNNRFEGTGMGLAICRKIVERHAGNITATSTPGHGSTFIITLPIQQS